MVEYKALAWLSAFLGKHSAVIFGLLIGTAAKFGRMMSIGQRITWPQVVGHFLMMGMVGVIATVLTDTAGIDDPNGRAFTASILAIAANDVLRYLATRGWKRFFGDPVTSAGYRAQSSQRQLSADRVFHDLDHPGEPIDDLDKGVMGVAATYDSAAKGKRK